MKLLVDTSVIIDFLRRKDKENSILYKISQEDLYASIVTHTEVYGGKSVWELDRARQEIETLFSNISILPLEIEISQVAGKIKAYNHDRTILDCIIAATSLHHGLELVTLNIKDFKKIKGLKITKISKMALAN